MCPLQLWHSRAAEWEYVYACVFVFVSLILCSCVTKMQIILCVHFSVSTAVCVTVLTSEQFRNWVDVINKGKVM